MDRDDPTEPFFVVTPGTGTREPSAPRFEPRALPPRDLPPLDADGRVLDWADELAAPPVAPLEDRQARPPPPRAPRAPRAPRSRRRSFWRRHFAPPSAFGGVVIAGVLAVVVAFGATFVYASVDAGRKLSTAPTATTRAAPPSTIATSDSGPTTTRAPENLSADDLAKKVAASVRGVHTRDDEGQPVDGTAFVVGSFGGQTLLLTSFALVRANTTAPGPGITLDGDRNATLWTWQEDRDLALLVTGGSIESLPWVSGPVNAGDKVYAAGAGQKLAVGVVTATSDVSIDHNIFVDDVRQGAPLVNQRGEVLGMVSKVYNPSGSGTDTQFSAIPIRAACDRVLRCGSGNASTPTSTPTSTPNPTTAATPTTTTPTTTRP